MSRLSNVTNKKEFYIICNNAHERMIVLTILIKEGVFWHGENRYKTGLQVERVYPFKYWHTIGIGSDGRKNFMNGRSDNPVGVMTGKDFLERYHDAE